MKAIKIEKGALVLYKNNPAVILEAGSKIEILLPGGKTKKVRDKDIVLLHQGPLKTPDTLRLKPCEIRDIWELLAGETLDLEQMAEFLYEDDGAESLWSAYLVLSQNIFFTGTPEEITTRSEEEVETYFQKVREEEEKEKEYNACLERLSGGKWEECDRAHMRDIEHLALGQSSSSKIFKALKKEQKPENAHNFLLKTGFWSVEKNPYPTRYGISVKSSDKTLKEYGECERKDLTHLKAYAIDDEGSTDPDDAISVENNRLWIHVTDVAALVRDGDPADVEASSRGSNLYLPELTVHMLPPEVTEKQGLGLNEISHALSYCVDFSDEGEIISRDVCLSKVKVERLSYKDAEERKEEDDFQNIIRLTDFFRKKRMDNGAISISLPEVKIRVKEDVEIKPLQNYSSRSFVSESMLIAGETAAEFCIKNRIPVPFACQLPPDAKGAPSEDLASMYVWRRKFKRGETKTTPEKHAGLGLNCYTRATSPLRRYPDLIVNRQIRSFLLGEKLMEEDEILLKVSSSFDSVRNNGACERMANLHWKLIYLSRNSEAEYEAILVEKKEKKSVFLIPELAMEAEMGSGEIQLNESVKVKVDKIDLAQLTCSFQMI